MRFTIFKTIKNSFVISFFPFLFLINIKPSFACDKWVRDFANDYCAAAKGLYNPLRKYEGLKIKYKPFITKKLHTSKRKELNNILISNITETCNSKGHLLLRIFR